MHAPGIWGIIIVAAVVILLFGFGSDMAKRNIAGVVAAHP